MTSLPLAVRAPGATAPSASPIRTQIRDLIYRVAGIFQANNKLGLLQERCHKRMQVLGIASLRDYYECLTVKPMRQAELVSLLNVITVGETCFFRNRAQLDAIQKIALPRIIEAKSKLSPQQLRIWSAGCSTGEEPYTLSMILLEEFQARLQGWTVEILGTDLNERSIAHAKAGSYGEHSTRNLDARFRSKYFNAQENKLCVKPEVQSRVNFSRLNLLDDARVVFLKGMDPILCCNVLIYFDAVSKNVVIYFDAVSKKE